MASSPPPRKPKKSPYAGDRGIPGAYDGETVTRRRFMEGSALAVGGVASAAFGLPALGFALGPIFEDTTAPSWQDIGPERDFTSLSYTPKIISLEAGVGAAGKTTIYVRRFNEETDGEAPPDTRQVTPYIAISTRCAHLGCPVRYIQASQRFICPCHGGVYDSQGTVIGGPPVRPLDRFYTKVEGGRVFVGDRFSMNSELKRFSPRDPSNHLDGPWQILYPKRPTA